MSNTNEPLVQIGEVSRREALRSIALAVTVVAGGQDEAGSCPTGSCARPGREKEHWLVQEEAVYRA
jgi:hypothetical protein